MTVQVAQWDFGTLKPSGGTRDLPIATQKLVTKEAAPVGVIKFLVRLSKATAAPASSKMLLNQRVRLVDAEGAVKEGV